MANIFLTGAGGDIGFATAKKFASLGHNLSLFAFSSYETLKQKTCDWETLFNIKLKIYKCDVTDPINVATCCNDALNSFGGCDLLINNAGMSVVKLDQDLSPDEWQKLCNTNLSSAMYFSRNVIPSMINNKAGKIINISSVWGDVGASCEVAYSASKGGVNSFTRALAKELAPSNIQVNAISCGAIDTEMNAFLCEEDRLALTEEIPASRFGTPEEIGEIALSLATGPSYLTGQIIRVDGAWI